MHLYKNRKKIDSKLIVGNHVKLNFLKERISSSLSSISGLISLLSGSSAACQTTCGTGSALFSLLPILGIAIAATPLILLEPYRPFIWLFAFILFLFASFLYLKYKRERESVSRELLLFNFGILSIGLPFAELQSFAAYFMYIGLLILSYSIILFVVRKLNIKLTMR